MKIKKILYFVMTLVIAISSLPIYSITSNAWPSAGTESCSVSAIGGYGKCSAVLTLSGASSVEGSTATYYIDRYEINEFKDLSSIYKVDFAMNGCVLTTSITSTKYTLTNPYINNQTWFSTSDNVQLSDSVDGTFVGDVPSVGTVEEITVTANISVSFKYNNFALTDSCSVSAKVKLVVIDSSALQAKIGTANLMKSSCWTESTWANYDAVVSEVKNVLKGKVVSQNAINDMSARLDNARNALVHNGSITECEYCRSRKNGSTTTPISYKDYVYGDDTVRQSMDLFLPSNVQGEASMILYIHGGGWIAGDRSMYTSTAYNECMKYGVATLAVNYRYTSPSVNGIDIMNDIQTAVTKAKEIGARHGLNITRLMTTGGSAGGHLALLYAYSRQETSPVRPVAVVSKCGPTNLTNKEYLDSNLGESTILYELGSMCGKYFNASTMDLAYNELLNVSPIKYVNANTVPTVICHGKKDITVPFSDAETLDKLLTLYGVPHHFLAYPNTNHALDNLDKELDPAYYWYSKQLFDEYVERYLKVGQPEQVHDYDTSTVDVTCTTDGYTTYTCKICGEYFVSDVVYASHSAGAVVRENENAATCSANGGYDEVAYCTICGAEVSRTHTTIDKLPHTVGEWEVVVPATYTTEGQMVKRCTICGAIVESQSIPVLSAPGISTKENTTIVIDKSNNLIKGVPQGTSKLDEYINHDDCMLEYERTANGFGTGTVVKVKSMSGTLLETYTIVVEGDVTGDGYVDAFDLAVACEHVNSFTQPEDKAYMTAVDIVSDGYLDATDLAFLIYIANFEY